MKPIVFYDTETTGLPLWNEPSESEGQPHIVQLAAILADQETRTIIGSLDFVVRPDGWAIPDEMTEIHGISNDVAQKVGVSEKDGTALFLDFCKDFPRVAHNKTFDQRIVRIALKRFGFTQEAIDQWAEKDNHYCTKRMATPIMKMEPKGKYGFKPPKLVEAYKHFFGEELVGAHTALADARACMMVYWKLIDAIKEQGDGVKPNK